MIYRDLYEKGKERLKKAGIDTPDTDAFHLFNHVFHVDRAQLLAGPMKPARREEEDEYLGLIESRSKRQPCQYLTGTTDFMGYTFKVNPSVLIPRQDTETLAEEALKIIPENADVLDLCTGSGCIGISLKKERPDIHMTLSDISGDALQVARENAEINEADVNIIHSDLFENITGSFDVIVSNPPYVTDAEYEELMPEVKEFEPKLALTAGPEGLDIYRRIANDAPSYLRHGGYLLLEIGYLQAESVRSLLEDDFEDIKVVKDLAGLDRVVSCRRK